VALAILLAACGAAAPAVDGVNQPPASADANQAANPTSGPTSGPASAPVSPRGAAPAVDPASGLPTIPLADLPPEGRTTVDLIDAGGPFPYPQDGAVFGNRERLLPRRPAGWYREYTVETPGSDDRGARRIVAGADGVLYWTEDHYASFTVVGE
jgi:ribonuclease T1